MNAVELLRQFNSITKKQVLVELGSKLQERLKNRRLDLLVAKVAYAAGILPYLKQRKLEDFLNGCIRD